MIRIGGFVSIMVRNLDRRGMGAEHQTVVVARARKVKGIVFLPRRMVRRDVERREVMPIVLDVRAFGDAELHFPQDRHHLVDGLADGMNAALAFGPDGKGDVDPFPGQPGVQFGIGRCPFFRLDGFGVLRFLGRSEPGRPLCGPPDSWRPGPSSAR